MVEVGRRSARGIIVDGQDLILIKRTRPGQDPYWVTPGGGVEPGDSSVEDALHREIREELGVAVTLVRQVYVHVEQVTGSIHVQHFFLGRLATVQSKSFTGPEFTQPNRGCYDLARIPFTVAGITSVRLVPTAMSDYLVGNMGELRSLVGFPRHV